MTTVSKSKPKIKRFRDPLSPKPILDRAALAKALRSNGVSLKDHQLDSFYQLLHRSGYPPLREFVAELRGGGDRGSVASACDNDGGSVSVAEGSGTGSSNFRTKNAISSRPGRRPQLPKSFLSYLADNIDDYATLTSKVQMHRTSEDGTTTKIVVELQDKHVVESVLMRHEGRVTICISSQVGCAMGCTFCATGTMGMRGNLSQGEILEQLVHGSRILARSTSSDEGEAGDDEMIESTSIPEEERSKKRRGRNKRPDLIRNVVFMGMGEPLNNYSNVLATCRALIDRRLWNLSHNRVTVSTVGVPARMRDLTRDLPEVNLALSLHAPDQETREQIVPAAKGAPVESLIEALDEHMMALAKRKLMGNRNPQQGGDRDGNFAVGTAEFNVEERRSASKKKRAMIEYVMLEGDTSTIEAAHKLGKLCEGRHLVVNLIPYNKTDVKDKLACPSEERMQEFRRIVSSYGSFCSIRRTMGADIAGACGQLVVEQEKGQSSVGDIEDGPFRKDGVGKRPITLSLKRDGKNKHDDQRSDKHPKSEAMEVDPWVRRLTVATAIVASCFVVSGTLLLLQKRKR
eukprot:CAMPEP_0181098588 /NCGR_PEP_ID=MMETSP1071-20121207/12205_1 /TAXON_ID=35127 /ORGANISM="Thalassiosira sp., Strain NH16" /LENGTH=572 /DNA_ID=CAMNT_0023181191 /DNA_START=65 /DNA_END=1783 /DNA_ORIENTATION=+